MKCHLNRCLRESIAMCLLHNDPTHQDCREHFIANIFYIIKKQKQNCPSVRTAEQFTRLKQFLEDHPDIVLEIL